MPGLRKPNLRRSLCPPPNRPELSVVRDWRRDPVVADMHFDAALTFLGDC